MPAYDVSLDMSLNMVIRGARDEAHAREIAATLAEHVAAANECLNGSDYGQPLVTIFSIGEIRGEIDVDELDDDDAPACRTEGCDGDPDNGEGWNGFCGDCADARDPA